MIGQNSSLTAQQIAMPERHSGYDLAQVDLPIFHGSATYLPETVRLPAQSGRLANERFRWSTPLVAANDRLSYSRGATRAMISCLSPYGRMAPLIQGKSGVLSCERS